jgi:hypothetical protein
MKPKKADIIEELAPEMAEAIRKGRPSISANKPMSEMTAAEQLAAIQAELVITRRILERDVKARHRAAAKKHFKELRKIAGCYDDNAKLLVGIKFLEEETERVIGGSVQTA